MTKDGQLNESSTKREIENCFTNARHVMDDLCRAYYDMTFDELIRLLGGRKENDEEKESDSHR